MLHMQDQLAIARQLQGEFKAMENYLEVFSNLISEMENALIGGFVAASTLDKLFYEMRYSVDFAALACRFKYLSDLLIAYVNDCEEKGVKNAN